jgi:hypothetical protein
LTTGQRITSFCGDFWGTIGEVALYDPALSSEEIASLAAREVNNFSRRLD